MGAAIDTVTAAYAAVSARRFDELASLLSPEIDWRGLPGEDGVVPRCHGRATALGIIRHGAAAAGEVAVSALSERDDRVLARVARSGRDGEWFVLADVSGGMISALRAYGDEAAARAALADELAERGG
jgi:ketosteroid isomerase-like protein